MSKPSTVLPFPALPLPSAGFRHTAPFLEALAEMEARLGALRECDPNSGARHSLEFATIVLRRAFTAAETATPWATLKDVQRITGRAMSTITDWANNYGKTEGWAEKKGIWRVDLNEFERWYAANRSALENRRHRDAAVDGDARVSEAA